MHPILLKIGPFTVYSYGFMLAVAILVCSFLLRRESKRQGLDPDIVFDLIFWVTIFGIIGSRIFFVFLNFSFFKANLLEIFMLHHGGLAWQGGLIFASMAGLFFIRLKKLPLWKTLDLVIPYAALGQAIGRIGCFFNGCCEGRPASWGVNFPVHGQRLHPTQLYSAVALFLIFFLLKFLQGRNLREGRIFFMYFMMVSFTRFWIQFLRADYSPQIFGLGVFQIVSLIFFGLAFYADMHFHRR